MCMWSLNGPFTSYSRGEIEHLKGRGQLQNPPIKSINDMSDRIWKKKQYLSSPDVNRSEHFGHPFCTFCASTGVMVKAFNTNATAINNCASRRNLPAQFLQYHYSDQEVPEQRKAKTTHLRPKPNASEESHFIVHAFPSTDRNLSGRSRSGSGYVVSL